MPVGQQFPTFRENVLLPASMFGVQQSVQNRRLSAFTTDGATAIVGTATNDKGSRPTVSVPSLTNSPHSPLPPSHLLAESRQATSYRLPACLSDVKRTSEMAKPCAQSPSAVFNIPFSAGDYKLQFAGSIR